MRSRLVTHWYCDHCRKVKHTRPAMVKHEQSCTANPDRACKMCAMAGLVQKPIAELDAALAEDSSLGDLNIDWGAFTAEQEKRLREATANCPACMLATLRQSKKMGFTFDWKAESKAWIAEHGKQYVHDYE